MILIDYWLANIILNHLPYFRCWLSLKRQQTIDTKHLLGPLKNKLLILSFILKCVSKFYIILSFSSSLKDDVNFVYSLASNLPHFFIIVHYSGDLFPNGEIKVHFSISHTYLLSNYKKVRSIPLWKSILHDQRYRIPKKFKRRWFHLWGRQCCDFLKLHFFRI